jgi:pimeloyl-ACP methyl ester carboxylesterase
LPRGNGRIVLVLPGFLTGDWATARHRAFLSSLGYCVAGSGLRFNPGPTRQVIADLEVRLLRWSERAGGPIALVGASLGGVFARALAQRHPDRVSRIVTLCSPIRFPVATSLAPFVWALEPFHDKDFAGLRGDIVRNPQAPVTAIYSQTDGIVDWRSCLQDEDATHVNVRIDGAHTTMGSNPAAQAVVARALAG